MPRDSGGAYTLPAGNPVISGTIIASTWANTTMDDLASAMTDSLSRSGNGAMTAPMKHTNGSESNPSITFNNDPLTGRYLAAVSDMRDTVNATDMARYTATAVELNYAGVKTFETTSGGIEVVGNITAIDTSASSAFITLAQSEGGVRFNADGDIFTIYQTGSTGSTQDKWIECIAEGAVNLHHNDILRLHTNSVGANVAGTVLSLTNSANTANSLRILNSEGGVKINNDGGQMNIQATNSAGTALQSWVKGVTNGATSLFYNGVESLTTGSNGCTMHGPSSKVDNPSTSECSFNIRNTDGGASITTNDGGFILRQTSNTGLNIDIWMRAFKDAQVSLYFNSAVKLSTTNTGIDVTGTVNEISDLKLKENLEVIPNALEKVCAMNGYTFDMIGQDTPRQTGVIAQEVQAVLPEAVGETDDGTLTVAYGNLVGLAFEAIKELKAEVELLKAAQ